MAIKGNLQKKVYRDRRTGVKRRWMEYSKVERWLSVRDKVTDWAPAFVAFFSIVFALFFLFTLKTLFRMTKNFYHCFGQVYVEVHFL